MSVLLYIVVPVLIVAAVSTTVWLRNRQPTSLEHGVDSFRREMDALSPDATPLHGQRVDAPKRTEAPKRAGPPRRPPGRT
ncbi:MAG: hypothetical protein KF906_02595 [Actinobacteria bacterium]|nr:hypothetical protein [Actinomycetota bacterium]